MTDTATTIDPGVTRCQALTMLGRPPDRRRAQCFQIATGMREGHCICERHQKMVWIEYVGQGETGVAASDPDDGGRPRP